MEIKDFENSRKPKNRYGLVIKILLGVFCVLVVTAGVFIYTLYTMATDDNTSSLFEDPREEAVVNDSDQVIIVPDNETSASSGTIEYNGKTYAKNENIVNLLFLGIDSDNEREALQMGYRSDMVMVCAVDVATKTATLISIPRDTYTTVYKIDMDTGTVSDTEQNRINTAFTFGGGFKRYSFWNSYTCVEMFLERRCELETDLDFTLDIPVYLYAGIDMDGIASVASAVGGVEVTLDTYIPGVGNEGQTLTLKGEKAETYLRDRHNSSGADIGRSAHQRTFMISLAKKIKSMGAVDMMTSLYDTLQNDVYTNLSLEQILDFAKILLNVDVDAIEQYTIEGTSAKSGTAYYYHDEEATLELLLDIYYVEVS
ncbi:MAG: LCP family protein [Eubacteriales bacterium]|nr:LCP family protein [Eubacteriales bacterium]